LRSKPRKRVQTNEAKSTNAVARHRVGALFA